jgi:hypothetical protein
MICGDFGGRAANGRLCHKVVSKPGRCPSHPFIVGELHPDAKKNALLNYFAQFACITHAADAAGLDRSTHYRWLEEDKSYEEAFKLAKLIARDNVHMELNRRGMYGVEEPVFQGGKKVGSVIKHSDALMTLLHKFHFPEVHKNVMELSGPEGGPVQHDFKGLSFQELAAAREAARASTAATE